MQTYTELRVADPRITLSFAAGAIADISSSFRDGLAISVLPSISSESRPDPTATRSEFRTSTFLLN